MTTAIEKPNKQETKDVCWVEPAVDVLENDAGFLVMADLPGVSPEGLKVEIRDSQLSIEGTSRNGTGYARRFFLPSSVAASEVRAELKQGLLRIELAKSGPHMPRQIPVSAG